MASLAELKGWIEVDASRLSNQEIEDLLSDGPNVASAFGGEFFIRWSECAARDHFGIMSGDCPPGAAICRGQIVADVNPTYPASDLGRAIEVAVDLRSDEGVVALSGGVDSALVARLAKRPCLAVGIEGSHDLKRSKQVAGELGLSLDSVVIDPASVEEALFQALKAIPKITPVDASVATTLYFVAERAGSQGYERILAGQGADELFGGYARYLQTNTLAEDMERDFLCLKDQAARDQAVAALHGAYFSLPYMDIRVVQVARAMPPEDKIRDGVRKRPLRDVASRYMPASIAYYDKKAMQYGSGIWKEIQRLASKAGYKKSVQEYLIRAAKSDEM